MAAPHVEPTKLAELGLHVFAVHGVVGEPGRFRCACGVEKCPAAGKHPLRRGWQAEATRDPSTILRLFRVEHNVGVKTGEIVVVDIDAKSDGFATLAGLEETHGSLPLTWASWTGGGGRHALFKAPPGIHIANSVNRLGQGVDVRGEGGFIVAPPSRHISGGEYAWDVDGHPEEIPVAVLPDWIAAACGASADRNAKPDLAGVVAAGLVEGRRNDTLARIAGLLFRRLDSRDAQLAAELVRSFNVTRCAPPLDVVEVEKILESIAGRELRRRRAAA